VVDSHTHLSSCEQPVDELVSAARAAGVTRIVTIGTDAENSGVALAAAERFPDVYAAVGHHPNEATGFGDSDYAALEQLARHPRCVAIGETGLDYYREYAPHDDQARAFRAQIEIAREVGKPLVIHTREADDDTLALLAQHADGLKVILHCFSMADRVDECLEHPDWFFSFAGNVTYPKNEDLRAAMLKVPAGRLLCETDAPYLSPQPVRRERNVPANVVLTAQAIALERRVSYHDFDLEVEAAAAEVFGWDA
jgi:TatD DNase family protein